MAVPVGGQMLDGGSVGELLAVSIPLAIGAGLSPMLLATTTGLLTGADHPRTRAVAFLVGALVPLAALIVITFTAIGPAISHAVNGADNVLALIDLGLGSFMLVVALWFTFRPPPRFHHEHRSTPRPIWWNGLLGVVLMGRDVSSMVLAFAALQHTAVASVGPVAKAVVAAAIVALVTMPIWVPIVAHVTIPTGLRQRMERTRDWAVAHEQGVVVTVCVVLGGYLLSRGATGH